LIEEWARRARLVSAILDFDSILLKLGGTKYYFYFIGQYIREVISIKLLIWWGVEV
jgi:hypothetical protein